MIDPPVDSPEGIARLVEWAKAHRVVLNEAHERIALKHGVSTDGVVISRPLPADHSGDATDMIRGMPIRWLSRDEAEAIWPTA